MNEMTLIIVAAVGAVMMVVFVVSRALIGSDKDTKLRDRLIANPAHDAQRTAAPALPRPRAQGVMPMFQRLGQAAAKPFLPNDREKQSTLRRNLGYAGIYNAGAIKVMQGFKVILLGGGILGGYAIGVATNQMLLGLSIGGLLGYLLPTIWLRLRSKRIRKSWPTVWPMGWI